MQEKRALNALEACQTFGGLTGQQLNEQWQAAAATTVKLGGGFYCAKIPWKKEKTTVDYYVFNGFFLTMRDEFVQPGASIYCFEVEWNANDLSWAHFRQRVLGPTDPQQAPKGSLRRILRDEYRQLGIASQPNKGMNGIHGSASPFEGLVERCNWYQRRFKDDAFGKALLAAGLSTNLLKEWSRDPRVQLDSDGNQGSLFDALEEMDTPACLEELVRISKLK